MNKEYEKVEPKIWKPEAPGDKIEGKLVSRKANVGVNKSMLYNIVDENNENIFFWGSTVLDQRLDVIQDNEYIRITFLGLEKNARKQDTKIFQVEREKKPKVTENDIIGYTE